MYAGRADYITVGRLDLYPKAFASREELVRTIYHELTHVKQFREHGTEFVLNNNGIFEKITEAAEEEFVENLIKEGLL